MKKDFVQSLFFAILLYSYKQEMKMRWWLTGVALGLTLQAAAQNPIQIDGDFMDWQAVPVAVTDPADDVHDTDGYPLGGKPLYRAYSDVDLIEVKFAHDDENLYGYMKATGVIGRTSSDTLGHARAGRYYFIFTIDVDDDTVTGYPLREGGYYPDSRGYDVNMEVEFYNGGFNTGHYINHEFLSQYQVDTQGIQDLKDGIIRLAPGTYDYYTQWVTLPDSSTILVSDRGPVIQGIITIAVSPDGHEAEIKAPMWGFLETPEGEPVVGLGKTIVVSASLEASGELSEEAVKRGYTPGSKSVWGSDTADPFRYTISDPSTKVSKGSSQLPRTIRLDQNYPNPFNPSTMICFELTEPQELTLVIYDVAGRVVTTIAQGKYSPGMHRVNWNGRDSQGRRVASGLYFYELRTETHRHVRKMIVAH
ncbi:T9SS type A sorting domain-containing protein [candidate division KSB1 bacterium]|nr:T9SS type A sorting domain-containing protein [candidate division KSB1 bacterium]